MSGAGTSAAYEAADVRLSGALDVEARFDLRNTSRRPVARRRGFRGKLPHLRFRNRDVDRGWRAPASTRRYRAWRVPAGRSALRASARGRPLRCFHLAHARERVLVLYARLALSAGAGDRRRRACAAGTRGRRHTADRASRKPVARRWPGVHAADGHDRSQSQPDSHHGPARYSGPLPGLLWRRVLDYSEPSAAHADLLLRVRRGVAHEIRLRP